MDTIENRFITILKNHRNLIFSMSLHFVLLILIISASYVDMTIFSMEQKNYSVSILSNTKNTNLLQIKDNSSINAIQNQKLLKEKINNDTNLTKTKKIISQEMAANKTIIKISDNLSLPKHEPLIKPTPTSTKKHLQYQKNNTYNPKSKPKENVLKTQKQLQHLHQPASKPNNSNMFKPNEKPKQSKINKKKIDNSIKNFESIKFML